MHIENGDLKDSDGNIFVFDFNENPKLSNFQNHIVLDEDETTSVPLMISDVEIRGWGSGGMINPTSDSVSLEILNNENWITYNQSNSTIIFTPSNNEVGEHDFTLKLTDKDGNFSEENLSITVNNVNDAPVLEAISDSSTDEDAAFSYQLTANDIDSEVTAVTQFDNNSEYYRHNGGSFLFGDNENFPYSNWIVHNLENGFPVNTVPTNQVTLDYGGFKSWDLLSAGYLIIGTGGGSTEAGNDQLGKFWYISKTGELLNSGQTLGYYDSYLLPEAQLNTIVVN